MMLIPYLFNCAKRDKIFFTILAMLLASLVISCFIGSTAAYEQTQMQIVYSAGTFRVILVYGFAIFNAFFITKMFQTREVETFLASPISRSSLISSIFFVNIILVASLSLIMCFLLKLLFFSVIPFLNIVIWCGNVMCETMIIVGVVTLFSLMLENATATILLTTIFYITSRIMGFIISSITLKFQGISAFSFLEFITLPVSVFFPRLDLFSQTSWLIYTDKIPNLTIIFTQSAIYIPLVFVACIIDFKKKVI